MSPIDQAIIKRKLAVIVRNLKALEDVSRISEEDYERQLLTRKATERLLQELIEAAIDINIHIIVQSGGSVPDSYYDSFLELGALGVVPLQLAQDLAPSAGLRNRLVHEYDSIDDSIVYSSLAQAIPCCVEYVRAIQGYLDKP
jgi:uncharacterized protein YutE (UPF0331/DUF86 family)